MQVENLYYAITQFAHNFGALAVVGAAVAGLKSPEGALSLKRKLAWLVLLGWGIQVGSGLIFGAITLYFYGEMPDLHATALVALAIKVTCAIFGVALALLYLTRATSLSEHRRYHLWLSLTIFGATALTAAAFLRWFS